MSSLRDLDANQLTGYVQLASALIDLGLDIGARMKQVAHDDGVTLAMWEQLKAENEISLRDKASTYGGGGGGGARMIEPGRHVSTPYPSAPPATRASYKLQDGQREFQLLLDVPPDEELADGEEIFSMNVSGETFYWIKPAGSQEAAPTGAQQIRVVRK